jgi:hypothetical protein
MDRTQFKKMLLILAENYGIQLTKSRMEAMCNLAHNTLGFNHDWQDVARQVALNEQFFPNIAVIGKYLQKETLQMLSPADQAVACVDRFISYLTGEINFEQITQEDWAYYRRKFGVTRYDYQSGLVKLEFRRKEWVDMVTYDFQHGVHHTTQVSLPAQPEILKLKKSMSLVDAISKKEKS